MKHKYVSVAGTLGIGKSTFTKLIAKNFGFKPILENFADNPFLPKFYKNMRQWAFHSQTFFLLEKINKIENIKKLIKKNSIVQDVPIYEDVFSYAKAQHWLGNMNENEWNLYMKIYKTYISNLIKPDLIFYLKAPIGEIYTRIEKRNRSYETRSGKKKLLDYLGVLDKLNADWIGKVKREIKIVTINTDGKNYFNDTGKKNTLIKSLKRLLNQ